MTKNIEYKIMASSKNIVQLRLHSGIIYKILSTKLKIDDIIVEIDEVNVHSHGKTKFFFTMKISIISTFFDKTGKYGFETEVSLDNSLIVNTNTSILPYNDAI